MFDNCLTPPVGSRFAHLERALEPEFYLSAVYIGCLREHFGRLFGFGLLLLQVAAFSLGAVECRPVSGSWTKGQ